MFLIGLTGSIGMGKTQTATLFEEEGVACYDADAAVHKLYEKGGAAVAPVGALVPEAIVDGAVNRDVLGQAVLKDRNKLKELEAIVHPLVGKAQMDFFEAQIEAKQEMVLLDVPLLFETGGDGYVDTVIVVSAPADIQRARVLARPGMSAERFEDILSKQVPDEEKRARAEFIVDSSISIEDARRQVRAILAQIKGREGSALADRIARYTES